MRFPLWVGRKNVYFGLFYFIEFQFIVTITKVYFVYFHVSFGVVAGFSFTFAQSKFKMFLQ